MNEFNTIIRTEWETKLESICCEIPQSENELRSSQSWDIIISQLIVPTLSLLINAGSLYYARKSFKNDEIKAMESKLETISNSIKEILENYNIDPEIIDAVMIEIGKKVLKL